MYDQSKLSELIRFARVDAGFTVIDVYPGDGDWTVSSPTSWDPKASRQTLLTATKSSLDERVWWDLMRLGLLN